MPQECRADMGLVDLSKPTQQTAGIGIGSVAFDADIAQDYRMNMTKNGRVGPVGIDAGIQKAQRTECFVCTGWKC